MKIIALVLVAVMTAADAGATDLSKITRGSVRVSPNGEYALWCRIPTSEWIKKSWKIPLYPFIIVASGHNIPLSWGFNSKCTIIDKNKKDLFDWPYGGGAPIWSKDGNAVSLDKGETFRQLNQ